MHLRICINVIQAQLHTAAHLLRDAQARVRAFAPAVTAAMATVDAAVALVHDAGGAPAARLAMARPGRENVVTRRELSVTVRCVSARCDEKAHFDGHVDRRLSQVSRGRLTHVFLSRKNIEC